MTTGNFSHDITTAKGQKDIVSLTKYIIANCQGCGHPERYHDANGFCRVCRYWVEKETIVSQCA